MTRPRSLPWLAAAVLVGATAQAQEHTGESLYTATRANVADSASTVGHLRLQLEVGAAFTLDKHAGGRLESWRTPISVCFGLADDLDLNLSTDGWAWDDDDPTGPGRQIERGFNDLSVGFKYRFHDLPEDDFWLPQAAVTFALQLPTGSREFREAGLFPSTHLIMEWPLPADFAIGVDLGATVARDDDRDRFVQGLFAVILARPLSPWLPAFGAFVEVFGQAPHTDRSRTLLGLDAGLTWTPLPDLQLDAIVTVGLSRAAPEVAVGFGVGVVF